MGVRPYSPAEVRLGLVAGRLALFNWGVLGVTFLIMTLGLIVPGLRTLLLQAGNLGWGVMVLMLASAFTVWGAAMYLVRRDPHLGASAWARWSLALIFLNLVAGNVYMVLWWQQWRTPAPE